MKHLFVSYEIAVALKELDFDEPCIAKWTIYNQGDPIELYPESQNFFKGPYFETCQNSDYLSGDEKDKIAAPLYDQIIDWFRERHNLVLWISPEGEFGDLFFRLYFMDLSKRAAQYQTTMGKDYFNHYENDLGIRKEYYDAWNTLIKDAIEIIKQKEGRKWLV
jgi:hypothetical protein